MPIIGVRDYENNRWKRKAKNKDRKEQRNDISFIESGKPKWLCCALKLGFIELICKASFIFQSNLDLASLSF